MDMDYVADAVVYEHERTLKNTRKRLRMCTEVCAWKNPETVEIPGFLVGPAGFEPATP